MSLEEKEEYYLNIYNEYNNACMNNESSIKLHNLLIELANAKIDFEEEKRNQEKTLKKVLN